MAYVYILHSRTVGRFYTGSCEDVVLRLAEHKNKVYASSYTSNIDDWELFFSSPELP